MKIGPRLILTIGLLAVISITISGIVYYFVAKQSIEKRVEAQMETAVILKGNRINHFLKMGVEEIEAIAGEKILIDNYIRTLKVEVRRLLKERLIHKENFFDFFILNLDGKIIVSTDELQEGKFKPVEDYFIQGEKETYLQGFFYDIELQQPIMAIATPVKDDGGEVIGVLAGKLNLESISDIMIERSGLGETGETYLVNKFNLLVSKSRFIEGIEFKKVIHTEGVKDCLKGNSGYGRYTDYRDIPVVGFYAWIAEREICLLAEIDQQEAFIPVRRFGSIMIFVGLGILFLTVILGTVLSRRITKPIIKLKDIAIEIGKGDLTKRAEIISKDEIGQLGMSFNLMVEEVLNMEKEKRSLTEKYMKKLEEMVAEKTSKLRSKVKELDKSRLILQSLAEDIQKEKETVEAKVKERTKEFSEEHGRLFSLVDSVSLGIVMVDLSLNIVLANPAAKSIFGRSPSENVIFEDLKEKMKGIEISQALSYYITEGKHLNVKEVKINNQYFRLFLSPVRNFAEKIFIGAVVIFEDITEQKNLDQMRTEIVSITSHQLRTPATVVKGNLEMVLEGDVGKITDEQRTILRETYLGNERMINLINDLMDVTKIDEGRLELKSEDAQLEDLAAEIVKELLPFAKEKGVSLSFTSLLSPLPKVKIDRLRMKQTLLNLTANALKYSSQPDGKGKVSIAIEKDDKFLKFIIKDNGIGIPKDEQDKIFSRFVRGSNVIKLDPGGGSGLGLYIAKAIIKQSGGKIRFESKENKGTTFYISLPI